MDFCRVKRAKGNGEGKAKPISFRFLLTRFWYCVMMVMEVREMRDQNEKKVRLQLVGLDGNAFALLGAFQKAARRQEWKEAEIKNIIKEATSGDYNHLLMTLMEYTDEPGESIGGSDVS